MKQAKGGNRERIISWLFNEQARQKAEEIEEQEKKEKVEKAEQVEKQKNVPEPQTITTKEVVSTPTPFSLPDNDTKVELPENIKEHVQIGDTDVTISVTPTEKTVEIVERPQKITQQYVDHSKEIEEIITNIPVDNSKRIDSTTPQPSLFVAEEIVETIKEENRKQHEETSTKFFPDTKPINEITEIAETKIERPELVQVSILEEINQLLNDDKAELDDIKYKIEVLQDKEKNEFLLDNIERIKRELEELIRRFEELKKKYDKAYTKLTLRDLTFINNSKDIEISIREYVDNAKDGNIDESFTEIIEIKNFIELINSIIEVEKEKDTVKESVDNKIDEYSIRDDEFIKLQDQYTDIEKVNYEIEKYNNQINRIVEDLKRKVESSTVTIDRQVQVTRQIVPNLNRIMRATLSLAATSMIPRTPTGTLFRAGLFAYAAHLMLNAFPVEERRREIVTPSLDDYTTELNDSKDQINKALDNISDALDQISYIKDLFDKQFSEYKDYIPEYAEMLHNIFTVEQELARQQTKALEFSTQIDYSKDENKEKVLIYEEFA